MEKSAISSNHWTEKRTIETGLVGGQYRVKEYEFDINKAFRSISILVASVLVSTALCPTLALIWATPVIIIIGGCIVVPIGIFQGYMERQYINGHIYRWWLEDSHNQVYRFEILVTEWANFVQSGNQISFFNRTLKRYGDILVGYVHCDWFKGKPIAYVDDVNCKRKAFNEFKLRYRQPKLTGVLLHMTYAGQEPKQKRYLEVKIEG